MKQIQLTKEEFKKLRAEAGFESEAELAEFLGFSFMSLNRWISFNIYPLYVLRILELCKNIEILKNNFDVKKL